MITLEQVIQLDEKIQIAVETITSLRSENNGLKEKLTEYQTRIEELEILIRDFKNDQGEIEEGILNAIKQLETVEGSIPAAVPPAPAETEAKETAEVAEPAVSEPEEEPVEATEVTKAEAPVETSEPATAEEQPEENVTPAETEPAEEPTSYEPEDEGAVELDIF